MLKVLESVAAIEISNNPKKFNRGRHKSFREPSGNKTSFNVISSSSDEEDNDKNCEKDTKISNVSKRKCSV